MGKSGELGSRPLDKRPDRDAFALIGLAFLYVPDSQPRKN